VDWQTVSALATGVGTLVLAAATFASVRSANRAARAAERGLLAGLRPLLMPSRLEDPPLKVGFVDGRWMSVPGGQAAAEASAEAVYLTISLRNVGTGIAVLHGWLFQPARPGGAVADLAAFTPQGRDLYIAAGDIGFWQGTYRDPGSPAFAAARAAVEGRTAFTVDLLYGDFEGGQRMVGRFLLTPRSEEDGWIVSVGRHWNLDGPDARHPDGG
jgi:hypothetical protein